MRLAGAPHGLSDFDRPADLAVNAKVETDEGDVGEQFGQEGLGHKVVVNDIVDVGPQRGGPHRGVVGGLVKYCLQQKDISNTCRHPHSIL